MKILETKQGAVTVVKPTGPLTQAEAGEFKQVGMRTLESNLGRMLVDMSAIPFVDSLGLEALVELTEEMTKSGQMLKLCAANKTLREVLTLTGLGPMFEHFD